MKKHLPQRHGGTEVREHKDPANFICLNTAYKISRIVYLEMAKRWFSGISLNKAICRIDVAGFWQRQYDRSQCSLTVTRFSLCLRASVVSLYFLKSPSDAVCFAERNDKDL